MVTLYARVHPKKGIETFHRCAISFTQAWQKLVDIDEATARRLAEEQMLEVSVEKPADYEESEQAGDSAGSTSQPGQKAGTPATAPTGSGDGAVNSGASNGQAGGSLTGTSVTAPAVAPAGAGAGGATAAFADAAVQRLRDILAAIAQLDANDESLWTAAGLPKTEAIAAILGSPVTAAERDAAVARCESEGK
ncbi:hypothetical protein [Herbaspirillum sp.]|uniref:hypothetical protein n=1 Tax=Herbaspirillum sp. TaxID=1890675 RepID=UPI001B209C97|nr:hypothetical protein [Herbaspirillum sp.]MBO9538760.1 hypothetical protein [Herbaspirillum sp.]